MERSSFNLWIRRVLTIIVVLLPVPTGGTGDYKLLKNIEFQTKVFKIHEMMNTNELMKYFAVTKPHEVPDYDLSYPIAVNEQGHEVQEHENFKRDLSPSIGHKFYDMNAFGKRYLLNLTKNENLLGPNFHIETRNSDRSVSVSGTPHRNFYHGHVISEPDSFVAVSDNQGLSGAIRTSEDEMLVVQPLANHLSGGYKSFSKHRPHLVVKRTANELNQLRKQMFEEEELPQEDWDYSEYEIPDHQSQHKFLEVVYVGDYLITEQIGLIELPEMLLIIGNVVARMFTDSTFGEKKIIYVITKIVILNNGELKYFKNATNGAKLAAFGRWMRKNNPADDEDPNHADIGTLFTSYTGGGLALSGGMCSYRDVRSVVGSIGLSSPPIAAHENFHNIGFGHDIDRGCPNGRNIMSTYVPSGNAAFTWSNCSRTYAQNFLRSHWSRCLNDIPQAKRPTHPPLLRGQLPGAIFDGDKQCEWKHAFGYKQCVRESCSTLFCTRDGITCYSSGGTPADGTTCGDGKWCIRGSCVDNGSPAVHGNWGSWSEYTSCTRTCDGGVQHRTRECNNPRPKNKGLQCVGSATGHYRTCNTEECPGGSISFRELQCKEKNENFTSIILQRAVCNLWCKKRNVAYLHGRVKDGTRCTKDPFNFDMCVNSECQTVGCDKQLNSDKVPDRCGRCDGLGTTCELKTANYTKNHRRYGFGNADTMLIVKNGSSNIHAKKRGKTWNFIGVQNMKGEYLLKLPSWSKVVYSAGTKIKYIRKGNLYSDEIIISGPVNQQLKLVFVYIRGRNQGVDINYYSPTNIVVEPSKKLFYWNSTRWSVCSKSCASGISTRKVSCYRRDDHTRVSNTACNEKRKPQSKISCNNQDCPPEWHSTISSCSRTCGKGVQLRKTVCRRLTTKSWVVVENNSCVGVPSTNLPYQQFCNQIACPPEYIPLPWSQCSTTCDLGLLTRGLKCEMINDDGISVILPNSTCEHSHAVKPATTEQCNYDQPCHHLPRYKEVGCFRDRGGKGRVFRMFKNLRGQIDWWHTSYTVGNCSIHAQERKAVYFAIQFYGECWGTTDPYVRYDKYGRSENCWYGLGEHWTNYVYKFQA